MGLRPVNASERPVGSLAELARLFLRLGTTAFGGPAAHVAMLEDEVVRRRGWLSHEEFLDLLAASNLIPGPNSTEMAIHIGYRRGGAAGLVTAGVCFILPATLIVSGLAWAYTRFGQLPAASHLLAGITPVIIAIIVQALWRLGRTAVKGPLAAVVGLGAVALNLMGVHELAVLAGAAFVVGVTEELTRRHRAGRGVPPLLLAFVPAVPLAGSAPAALAAGSVGAGLWPLFLFFLKVGSVLYGSGYVLLAFLRADLVERWGWLTQRQLLDAVAVGQITPGPLFTTATFIGYILAGPAGAAVATTGIFLPAFVFVAISAPLVPRLRRSPTAGAFLDGLNVGSLALMAVVSWALAKAVFFDPATGALSWRSVAIAAVTGLLLARFRINSTWLVAGGAAVGLVLNR